MQIYSQGERLSSVECQSLRFNHEGHEEHEVNDELSGFVAFARFVVRSYFSGVRRADRLDERVE